MRITRLLLLTLSSCALDEELADLEAVESGIHNGIPTSPENSGHVRLTFALPGGFTGLCSGSLMENGMVLTARHCFDSTSTIANLTVSMGSQARVAAELIPHPTQDVAIVRLSTPFAINSSTAGFRRDLYPGPTTDHTTGTYLNCFGYGFTDHDDNSTGMVLHTAALPVRGVNFSYGIHSFDLGLDANAIGQFNSFGDSGGACWKHVNGSPVLAGVNSFMTDDLLTGTKVNGLVSAANVRPWFEGNAAWFPHGWQTLGGGLVGGPGIGSRGNQSLDVFVRGANHRLFQNTRSGVGTWSGWSQFDPAVATSDPAVVSRGTNTLDLFVRLADNAIWTRSFNGSQWSNWTSLGGGFTSAPTVAVESPTRMHVFGRGFDNTIYHQVWNGTTGNGWTSISSDTVGSDPAAISFGPGHVTVFAHGTDGAMYQNRGNGNGSWTGWAHLGGFFTSAPAVSSAVPGTLELFGRGGDNKLYSLRSNDGVSWSQPWTQVSSTPVGSAPDAVAIQGVSHLVVQGTDGAGHWMTKR